MLGAVLTTLLLSLLAPTQGLLVVLDAIMAYLAFSVLFVNYALFSAFLTMETVFLLTFVTPQPLITAEYRAIDTAVGGILALLIYILWPTWESSQVPRNLADRLEALRHYCVAVMEAYANPRAYDAPTLLNLRMELRLARSNAQGSVERALHEPKPDRIDPDLAQGVLRATDNIAQCALALEAYLIDNPARHALSEMSTFAKKVDEALHLLATAIREEQSVSTLPDLQKALQALKHSRKSAPDTENEADLQFVLTEAKRIIRNINTIYQILSTKRRQGEPVSRTGF
jgi:uncharacterized membrane protein YccC